MVWIYEHGKSISFEEVPGTIRQSENKTFFCSRCLWQNVASLGLNTRPRPTTSGLTPTSRYTILCFLKNTRLVSGLDSIWDRDLIFETETFENFLKPRPLSCVKKLRYSNNLWYGELTTLEVTERYEDFSMFIC